MGLAGDWSRFSVCAKNQMAENEDALQELPLMTFFTQPTKPVYFHVTMILLLATLAGMWTLTRQWEIIPLIGVMAGMWGTV